MDPRLIELGLDVAALAAKNVRQLDEQGFTILEGIIDPIWLDGLRDAFEQVYQAEGAAAGKEVAQVEGVRRLADLVNKGVVFDNLYIQSQLLSAVWHVLQRPFKLHSVNGHDPLPGYGQQGLHADWGGERSTGRYHVVNSMWMLDDMTPDNGATRLVPGSHRTAYPHERDPFSNHHIRCYPPEEQAQTIEVAAGGAAFFCYGTAHSTGDNHSSESRTGMAFHFLHSDHTADDLVAADRDRRPWITGPQAAGGLKEYGVDVRGSFQQLCETA